jgi:hypothetical protein
MERIAMSREERAELHWLKKAKDGVIAQRDAAEKMGVSDRIGWKQLGEARHPRSVCGYRL